RHTHHTPLLSFPTRRSSDLAPSATVFAICQQKIASNKPASLVLGIPDERAPQILSEVQSVAALLPHTELLVGKQATSQILREKGDRKSTRLNSSHRTISYAV